MEKAASRGASRSRGLKHRIIRMLLRSPCSTCIASENGAKLSSARPLVHLEQRKQTRWPMASLEQEEEEEEEERRRMEWFDNGEVGEEEKRRMEWFDNGEVEEELGSLHCNYYGGNQRPRQKSRRRSGSGSGRGSCVEGEEEEAAGGFFAVPTRSSDPYSDFWRSMAEMVVAGQHMGSAKEMEKLLRSYLSLNSPVHHPVIVAAFVDVWEVFMA